MGLCSGWLCHVLGPRGSNTFNPPGCGCSYGTLEAQLLRHILHSCWLILVSARGSEADELARERAEEEAARRESDSSSHASSSESESANESDEVPATGLEATVEDIGDALKDSLPADDPGHFTLEQLSSFVDMGGLLG